MRRASFILVCLLALLIGACSSGERAAGSVAATPTISHVVIIAFENHSRVQVIGHAPYLDSLASTYGEATDYVNIAHPSLPNYLAVTSGSTHGVTSDCHPTQCPQSANNVFKQAGSSWKAYDESMPSHCDKTDSGSYAAKHNPAVYYTDLTNCGTLDVALASSPSAAAKITFVTPNLCHDMHDCSVASGDAWAKVWIPKFMNTTQYKAGTTAILLWWDENTSAGPTLPFIVVSPYTHNVSYSGRIDHYATLRTVESLLGFPCLGTACSRTSFAAAFGL